MLRGIRVYNLRAVENDDPFEVVDSLVSGVDTACGSTICEAPLILPSHLPVGVFIPRSTQTFALRPAQQFHCALRVSAMKQFYQALVNMTPTQVCRMRRKARYFLLPHSARVGDVQLALRTRHVASLSSSGLRSGDGVIWSISASGTVVFWFT